MGVPEEVNLSENHAALLKFYEGLLVTFRFPLDKSSVCVLIFIDLFYMEKATWRNFSQAVCLIRWG